jgi:hypothetical protein
MILLVAMSAFAGDKVVVHGGPLDVPGQIYRPEITIVIPRLEPREAQPALDESLLPKLIATVDSPPIE